MKIRNGFVSNSSSSSFIFITTLKEHEKAVQKTLPDDTHGFLSIIFDCVKTQEFNGEEIIIVTGSSCDYECCGGLCSYDLELHREESEELYECWNRLVDPIWDTYLSHIPKDKCIEEWENN